MGDQSPSSSGRSRREIKDKTGRFAALQKLKELKAKGVKNKCEVGEVINVYDEVDEKEYAKTLVERQASDWIVDDGGVGGYIEDGREIFDDDLDPESIEKHSRETSRLSGSGLKKRKRPEDLKPAAKSNNNIMNMLQGMPTKKLRTDQKLTGASEDDLQAFLLQELGKKKLDESKPKPVVKNNKFSIAPKVPPAPVSAPAPAPAPVPVVAVDSDEDIVEIFDRPSVKKTLVPPQQSASKTNGKTEQINKTVKHSEKEKKNVQDEYIDLVQDFPDDDGDFDIIEVVPPAKPVVPPAKPAPVVAQPKIPTIHIELDPEFPEFDFSDDLSVVSASQTEITAPIVVNKNSNDILRFYWLDATEDPYKQPGVVNLFGKVYHQVSNTFVSCCLVVKNIPRILYCLPRENIKTDDGEELNSMKNVYDEWNQLATSKKITKHLSQSVNKRYAFDREGTPLKSDYLKVLYSASFPAVDADYEGKAIEHIFGTSANALEIFLVERGIMGPCWLEVKGAMPIQYPSTWTELQYNCMDMKNISIAAEPKDVSEVEKKQLTEVPPAAIMVLNIRTTLNSKTQANEIAMIGVLSNNRYPIDKPPPKLVFEQKCFVTRPKDRTWPLYASDTLSKFKDTKIVICETEVELLERFLDYLRQIDADFLIGYDCGFQFDALVRRISSLRVKNWMRTARLKSGYTALYKGKVNMARAFCGRVICDVQVAAKEVNVKVRSYDLDSICSAVLDTKPNTIIDITPILCPEYYQETNKLLDLVKMTMNEAKYMLSLVFKMNIIPLALQITCIAGNVLSRTFSAGRSERNEWLLLHAFSKQGYITPDRKVVARKSDQESTKKKAAYAGGLVLDPQKGFYDQLILLMDFNSLYPSIIQEFNICFTTIDGACYRELTGADVPEQDVEFGIVPTQIRQLVERRVKVKNELKNGNLSAEKKMELNIRQLAYKLTANSMYGCLGASHSRFYAKNLAALVTLKGREILQGTKTLVEQLNYRVIYGDTDSIMIDSKINNYDEALEIAKKIKYEVNKLYNSIELDIDGVFKYMLLLNKKKYAAVSLTKLPDGKIDYKTEIKGLDIVRRDWCQLASDAGRQVINKIFMDLPIEEKISNIRDLLQTLAKNFRNLAKDVRLDKAPLSSLVITKQLSKNPKDYPDNKQPHVAIALRLNEAGGRMWKAGDTIPYIICLDETTKTPMERAYHIDEFKKNPDLQIDTDYYFRLQIIPVIERITAPLPELDGCFLAECLGITGYKSKITSANSAAADAAALDDGFAAGNEKHFENCEAFTFKCQNKECLSVNVIEGFFLKNETEKTTTPAMLACVNKNCQLPPWKYQKRLQNDLQRAIRQKINKYYQSLFHCDNCSTSTRNYRMGKRNSGPVCIKCGKSGVRREYSSIDLHNQLEFYQFIFNPDDDSNTTTLPDTQSDDQTLSKYPSEMLDACRILRDFVDKYFRKSSYAIIDFQDLLYLQNRRPWDGPSFARKYISINRVDKFKESRQILDTIANPKDTEDTGDLSE